MSRLKNNKLRRERKHGNLFIGYKRKEPIFMSVAKVVSLNIGQPKTVMLDGTEMTTAIYKSPVDSPLLLTKTNIVGDGQADLVNHGGFDQAVCVYCSEHFLFWEHLYQRPFEPGAFGENITLFGRTEEEICIGDVFQIGTAIVQVSQPRQPCFKLAKRHGIKDLPLKIQQTGYTGFYLRTIKEGMIQRGDELHLLDRSKNPLSIQYINKAKYGKQTNVEALQEIIEEPALSEAWRNTFLKKLQNLLKK